MMRRLLLISLLLLSGICGFQAAAQPDSLKSRYAPLDSMLTQFYTALERETVEVKCDNADFLIGTCKDSLTRQHVALALFDHYRDSRVMGEEAVAIYVYDTWFESGAVSFQGEMDKLDADVFVKFNRDSQIGCDAPMITLFKPCGGRETLPAKDRTSILFFHDTHCAKCRLEATVMPSVLKDVDFKMDFYAVYCGSDRKSWRQFRREFKLRNPNITVHHLWDPEMESDYQMRYAVLGTPRVYLVEPGGSILGRRLEPESIKELLPYAGAIQAAYLKTLDKSR